MTPINVYYSNELDFFCFDYKEYYRNQNKKASKLLRPLRTQCHRYIATRANALIYTRGVLMERPNTL